MLSAQSYWCLALWLSSHSLSLFARSTLVSGWSFILIITFDSNDGSLFQVDWNIRVVASDSVLEAGDEFGLINSLNSRVQIYILLVGIRRGVFGGELRGTSVSCTGDSLFSLNLSISLIGNVDPQNSFDNVLEGNNPDYLDLRECQKLSFVEVWRGVETFVHQLHLFL